MLALTQRRNPTNSASVIAPRQRRDLGCWRQRSATTPRSALLPNSPSNGEVEGPGTHVGQGPRVHNLSRVPRPQTDHASRPPPTIVRTRFHNQQSPEEQISSKQ